MKQDKYDVVWGLIEGLKISAIFWAGMQYADYRADRADIQYLPAPITHSALVEHPRTNVIDHLVILNEQREGIEAIQRED